MESAYELQETSVSLSAILGLKNTSFKRYCLGYCFSLGLVGVFQGFSTEGCVLARRLGLMNVTLSLFSLGNNLRIG